MDPARIFDGGRVPARSWKIITRAVRHLMLSEHQGAVLSILAYADAYDSSDHSDFHRPFPGADVELGPEDPYLCRRRRNDKR